MRPGRLLNPDLAAAVASLGHTDVLLVTDAGFPIPASAHRIDLALAPGVPTVPQVLEVLRQQMFVERIDFAPEVRTHNPRLYARLQEIWTGSGATFAATSHEDLCADVVRRAKVVVRTGDFDPWANIALTASTDPFAWFTDDAREAGLRILPDYEKRRAAMTAGEVPALPEDAVPASGG